MNGGDAVALEHGDKVPSFFLLKEMSGKLVVSLNPFSVTVITMP